VTLDSSENQLNYCAVGNDDDDDDDDEDKK
jgi:hypothetical protein